MTNNKNLKVGQKVNYIPNHYKNGRFENGIIKEIPSDITDVVRVVYNCGGDWFNYRNYTSALTNVRDLHYGWVIKKEGHDETV